MSRKGCVAAPGNCCCGTKPGAASRPIATQGRSYKGPRKCSRLGVCGESPIAFFKDNYLLRNSAYRTSLCFKCIERTNFTPVLISTCTARR